MKRIIRWLSPVIMITSFSVLGQEVPESQAGQPSPEEPALEVQEIKYVTDNLLLSLYKQSNSNSTALKLLSSGDKLGILSKSGPYSRVKTEDGLIGWVKNGFLVDTPTASLLLDQEIKKNEALKSQLEKLSDSKKLVENYEETINTMKSDLDQRSQQLDRVNESLQQMGDENTELEQQIVRLQEEGIELSELILLVKQYWYVAALIILLVFFVGLVTGRGMVEAQVRRRFQGVKVW